MRGTMRCSEHLNPHPCAPLPLGEGRRGEGASAWDEGVACDLGRADTRDVVLTRDLRAALALWPELAADAGTLLARWRRRVPGWNRWSFGRVRLTLVIDDVAEVLPQLPENAVDAWFLDGFTPAKNPEMWSEPVLHDIARASRAATGAQIAMSPASGR